VVGWRTDNFNYASQAAIERLGAKKDGVIRGHALRRDGTIRDTVMYSLRAGEWPEAQSAAALPAGAPGARRARHFRRITMLIDFFYTLRSAKLPVSVKEYLTLLEALQANVVGPNSERSAVQGSMTSTTSRAPRWSRTRSTTTSSTAPSPPTSRASR
jgi:hypothetical protein